MAKKRIVVVTTDKDRRGVFCGDLVSEEEGVVVLKSARMAVYWSTETKGVLGLASIGPQKGSRITPVVPKIKLNGVTSVIDCTKEAVKKWGAGIWS
jgi:hypothetical protein